MRTADIVTAAALMLLGGVVLYDAVRLGIGWGTDGPRSGFFPFWLALLMVAVSALVLAQAARRLSPRPCATRAQAKPVLTVLWPAVAMLVLMQLSGLYVAAACCVGFHMRWIGHHRWVTVAAIAVSVPVVTFFSFGTWFLVPMPKGPLEAWLGY